VIFLSLLPFTVMLYLWTPIALTR